MNALALMATLGLDINNYESNLKKAQEEAEKAAGGMSGALDDVEDSANDAGDAIGGISKQVNFGAVIDGLGNIESKLTGIVTGVFNLGKQLVGAGIDASTWADNLITESQQFGIDRTMLQQMQYASKFIDTDVGTIEMSMQRLTRNMYNAQQGSEEAANSFTSLGISFADEEGNLRSTADVFWDIIDALHNTENQAERDGMAMMLLGRNVASLGPLVQSGSEAYREYMEQAPVIAEDQVKALGDLNDAYQDIQSQIEATKISVLSGLSPAFSGAITRISDFFKSERGAAAIEKIAAALQKLIETLTTSENLEAIFDIITSAIEALASAFQWLAENSDIVKGALTGIVGLLGGTKLAEGALNIGQLITGARGLLGLGGAGTVAGGAAGGGILSGIGGFLSKAFPIAAVVAGGAQVSYELDQKGIRDSKGILWTDTQTGYYDALNKAGGKTRETFEKLNEIADDDRFEDMGEQVAAVKDGLVDLGPVLENLLPDLEALGELRKNHEEFDTENGFDWASALASNEITGEEWLEIAVSAYDALKEKIDSGITEGGDSGAKALGDSLETEGVEAVGVIQTALNGLGLPNLSFGFPFFGASGHASGMENGEILRGITPFGVDGRGTVHYGGEAGAEAVVGVSSLRGMIQQSVNNALGGLRLQVVLDSGVLVGEIAPQMDTALNDIADWKGGGRAG